MAATTDLADAVIAVLGIEALDRSTIQARLSEEGVQATRDQVDRLLQRDPRFAEIGERVLFVPAVLEATTWTTFVHAEDAAEGFVRCDPNLEPLVWWLIEAGAPLADEAGQVLGQLSTDGIILKDVDTAELVDSEVLYGPDGWLDAVAGGWASITVVDGALRLAACPVPPSPTPDQVRAFQAVFESAVETNRSMHEEPPPDSRYGSFSTPLYAAILHDRDAFTSVPLPPLPALFAAAGFELRGGLVAPQGFDWDDLAAWQDRQRLKVQHGLTSGDVEAVQAVVGACLAFGHDGDTALGPDEEQQEKGAILLSALLEESAVAFACWSEWERRGVPVEQLDRFAELLLHWMEGVPVAGATWLRAQCLDLQGDTARAVEMIDAFDLAGCDHVPLLVMAAGFASDRGDAPTAYRRLRQAGLVTDAESNPLERRFEWRREALLLVEEVEGLALHRPPAAARRNDPCPCGSGRKYKACHQGKEQHSLHDRAGWLHLKMGRFFRERHRDHLEELADLLTEHQPQLFEELVWSPIVADLLMQDTEAMTSFLDSRSWLLPDDEANLALQWNLVEWSLFEVDDVRPDRLRVRDVRTGDHLTVSNVTPNETTQVGSLFAGRVHPVGDDLRVLAGLIPVKPRWMDDVIDALDEGDPFGVAYELGRMMAPPRLQNTDGDDMEFHTLRWRVTDPESVDDALVAVGFERQDEGRWTLLRSDEAAVDFGDDAERVDDELGDLSGRTITATVELNGEELVIQVNSARRAEFAGTLIDTALPAAQFIDDEVRSLDELMAAADEREGPPRLGEPDSPELREAVAQVTALFERRWLDESIPALGGLTPREAAADPVAREDLKRLLASFPPVAEGDEGMMNPQRLRDALGL